LMSALPDYIYSVCGNTVYVNLHVASELEYKSEVGTATIIQKHCGLPYHGHSEIALKVGKPIMLNIAVRIPEWAGEYRFALNGSAVAYTMDRGYALFCKTWSDGDVIGIEMDLPILKIEAHPYVTANAGRVALQRGPLLYCVEACDNDNDVNFDLGTDRLEACSCDLFGPCVKITGQTVDGRHFTAVPYYLWGNRDKGTMAVWIRQKEDTPYEVKRNDLTGWADRLYREYIPTETTMT